MLTDLQDHIVTASLFEYLWAKAASHERDGWYSLHFNHKDKVFRRAVLFGHGDSVLVGIEDPDTNLMILKIDQMATTGLTI